MENNAFTRRLVLGSSAALLAAGCADVLGPPPAPKLYLLHPALPAPGGAKLPGLLSVAAPKADAGFDSERIAIEQPGGVLDYYADAAWPDHLTVLLQNALTQAFEGSIDTMTGDAGGLEANYILMTAVRDFEARYAVQDGIPTAVVRLDVHLLDTKKRSEIGHFIAASEVPASANTIEAAVAALNAALSSVLADCVKQSLAAMADTLP